MTYKACPSCTYPLKRMLLGYENGKEVVRTYCSNKKCTYEKVMKRKSKYGSRS